MSPYYEQDGITIYHGDCRDILQSLDVKFDTCLTDPPYGLEFMAKGWDRGVPGVEFWKIISNALKPGALCLSFGGTRTFHRLTCAVEDAGFEIRDCLMWLYGSGFPKSLDISKAIDKAIGEEREVTGLREEHNICRPKGGGDERLMTSRGNRETKTVLETTPSSDAAKLWNGYGTALKPAWEPIILAMKPLDGTFAENSQRHGVAGINIEGTRIAHASPADLEISKAKNPGRVDKVTSGVYGKNRPQQGITPTGRFPANLILDEEAAKMLDEQSGERGGAAPPSQTGSATTANAYGKYTKRSPVFHGDSGGASRFFYTAKASGKDRNDGYNVRNNHPTVKPLDLMLYLCKLTSTPTGGSILDPFMGSGTTLRAARHLGRKAIGIETEERYCEIAANRLAQRVLNFGEPS